MKLTSTFNERLEKEAEDHCVHLTEVQRGRSPIRKIVQWIYNNCQEIRNDLEKFKTNKKENYKIQ